MNKITLQRILQFTKGFILDKDRKNLREFIQDFKFLKAEGELWESPKVYIRSLMYKKDTGPLDRYMLGKMYAKIVKHSEEKLGKDPILENKLAFRALMKEHDLPHPSYLGKIESGVLFTENGSQIPLTDEKEAKSFIQRWLEKHQQIFIKPTGTYGGKGILKFELGQPIDLSALPDSQYTFIIEKGIIQHETLNRINPYCVNSLRVTTLNLNGEVGIPAAFLRMGVDKSHVDNLSTGGIFVNYDLQQNKLGKTAYRTAKYGGKRFLKHPDTGFVFENKPLPFRDSIEDMVLKAADLFPELDMIGWDLAMTPEGPLLIEGNSNATIIRNQVILKGLKNSPLFRDYLTQFA